MTRATSELVAAADLLVVCSPTHMHGMSGAASRRSAAETARKQGSGLAMDPDADGPDVRGWLDGDQCGTRARHGLRHAAQRNPALTGRASRGISGLLRRRGYRLLLAPESFLVSRSRTNVDSATLRTVCPG